MAINNPTGYYPDFIINDISASAASYGLSEVTLPILFTIDGPLSIKGTGKPYTLTVSKLKDR